MKRDAADISKQEGPSALREAFDRSVKTQKAKAKFNGQLGTGRFKLKRYEEIVLSTDPDYVIKHLIPRAGMGILWGQPKCGKSFFAYDLAMHVALGWKYRGRRVQQGAVVYLALEGGAGFAKRKQAWHDKYIPDRREPVPFYLLDVSVNLIADDKEFIQSVQAQLAPSDGALALVVVDTLNRALVGSENDPKDMGKFVRAADTIRAALGCAVLIIHHCGVDGSRMRGHTGLPGAEDFEIAVSRDDDDNVMAKVEAMKDDASGDIIPSKLEQVPVGKDRDGDVITSCVITALEGSDGIDAIDAFQAKKSKTSKSTKTVKSAGDLSAKEDNALRALHECITEQGTKPPPDIKAPPRVDDKEWREYRVVTEDDWREHLLNRSIIQVESNDRQQFKRLHTGLTKKGWIGIWKKQVWTFGPPP